ncbi:MAG: hypothetical protein DI586_06250 [Micavibrio aeruginosavorus]|uniref:Uncharacterized protein n=1 Tax=Micavibrio aeruginosavorus TaxID=349221 RepID=A0A2W5FKW3_9BACT|nr:MAG: hypothetical protein DI586_06250 [Micavibrio aeruginosavorus]
MDAMNSNTLNIFYPLQLPAFYTDHSYRMSIPRQLWIALTLNILSLALPIMMLQAYDRIIPHNSYGSLVALVFIVLIALAMDVTLRIIRSYLISWSSSSSEHAANCAAIELFCRANLDKFESISSGEQLQDLNAISKLREFYSGQAWASLIDLPFIVIFLGLIGYLGGSLVLIPICLLGLFFLNTLLTGNVLKRALERRTASDDQKASLVVSVLKGIHTVKSLSLESFLLRKFEINQAEVSRDSYLVASASGKASTVSAGFGQLSLIMTVTAGMFLVLEGSLTVGGLSACTLLAGRCIQPVQRVLATWLRLQDLTLAKEQASALFNIPVMRRAEKNHLIFQGRISLDNVTYTSPMGNFSLQSISLQVEPGSIVAITGDDGAAKSALLQIIAGIISPESGSVFVDEIEPSSYSLSDMRSLIGYLPQDGAIFKGSILENMTGFRHDDNIVKDAIEAGAELGLDKVIDLLPHGYQTMLTDSAADPIPPGVKQRISLSRIITNKPSILLFDDADRALDKTGYNLLFRLIGRLKGQSTIILVTQDQNLLSFADFFLHLENGSLSVVNPSGTQNLAILSHLQQGQS